MKKKKKIPKKIKKKQIGQLVIYLNGKKSVKKKQKIKKKKKLKKSKPKMIIFQK